MEDEKRLGKKHGDPWQEDFQQCDRLFVYGTLKPGGVYWEQYCRGVASDIGEARVGGEIYHLPMGYPAASLGGTGWIHGYILQLPNSDLLRQLDRLEGYWPGVGGSDNEYVRILAKCRLIDTGEKNDVWFYHMDAKRIQARGGLLIPDGDWNPKKASS